MKGKALLSPHELRAQLKVPYTKTTFLAYTCRQGEKKVEHKTKHNCSSFHPWS
jgi:hypothetical protein